LLEEASDMRTTQPFPQDLAAFPSIASVNLDEVSDFPLVKRCGLRPVKALPQDLAAYPSIASVSHDGSLRKTPMPIHHGKRETF
jgi:hypothetical protein